MIVDKHQPIIEPEVESPDLGGLEIPSPEAEQYEINALSEAFRAIKTILLSIPSDKDPNKPYFQSVQMNRGQVDKLKHSKWNREGAIRLPAAFIHFIDVRYLVQALRIGEGRATCRIQYVLNRLNVADTEFETEGYDMFQKIHNAIQSQQALFPSLTERFQLNYFDQPESFDNGVQVFWIDYEIWFREYYAYRYKDWKETYVVVPPFTDREDQNDIANPYQLPNFNSPTLEEVAGFEIPESENLVV